MFRIKNVEVRERKGMWNMTVKIHIGDESVLKMMNYLVFHWWDHSIQLNPYNFIYIILRKRFEARTRLPEPT